MKIQNVIRTKEMHQSAADVTDKSGGGVTRTNANVKHVKVMINKLRVEK